MTRFEDYVGYVKETFESNFYNSNIDIKYKSNTSAILSYSDHPIIDINNGKFKNKEGIKIPIINIGIDPEVKSHLKQVVLEHLINLVIKKEGFIINKTSPHYSF